MQTPQIGVYHHTPALQYGQKIVSGGLQKLSMTNEVKTSAFGHPFSMGMGLRLATSTKMIHDILPCPFGNVRVADGKVGFAQGHSQ
jgi:hypothetical protein